MRSASKPSRSTSWSSHAVRWAQRPRPPGEGPRERRVLPAAVTPRALLERLVRALGSDRAPRYRGLRGAGQRWEELAEKRLRAEGYSIRDRNFRGAAGEIDLIAAEPGVLCLIEVKG